ncbi:MAG: hydroxyacylglutathione hydrolase, partial [Pseudoxanthomonas sp.]|nr:hydroxyacylglutathione hydrolase [Pseudoxanthomonas sp.]
NGWDFEVIAVPGHTLSHIAFHGAGGHLFCGDTLFSMGCGRLFEGTPAQMLGSLERLAALPGETAVCCGHEYTLANAAFARAVDPANPALRSRTQEAQAMRDAGRPTLPVSMATERATNPFLRVDAAAVRDSVARRLGRQPGSRVEVFAELRRWKDGFPA